MSREGRETGGQEGRKGEPEKERHGGARGTAREGERHVEGADLGERRTKSRVFFIVMKCLSRKAIR